jgi:hypothetical protein
MNTQSIHIQSDNRDLEPRAHRLRVRRRQAATLTRGQDANAARGAASGDRPNATHQGGGARILRRWSVSDLIARAGGAPRAFA